MRVRSIARGLAAGLVPGAGWGLVERGVNRAVGGHVSAEVAVGGFAVDEIAGSRRWGSAVVLMLALVPLGAVLADRAFGLAVRRRGVRLGLELGAAVLAALIWGRPLSTAPLVDPIVTGVAPA